ncbi:hypothetical protein Nepgr_013103 [Nepenthes gracilis]|uniref:Uncharacterized protein n=1 Tax=Nepenthes gracilis TaxID=150966 RepID=A0AAD3XND0_NEPGR|nr:hypothetical protein Nepgr_013103 [Nepenthes gracilis]
MNDCDRLCLEVLFVFSSDESPFQYNFPRDAVIRSHKDFSSPFLFGESVLVHRNRLRKQLEVRALSFLLKLLKISILVTRKKKRKS